MFGRLMSEESSSTSVSGVWIQGQGPETNEGSRNRARRGTRRHPELHN